VSLAYTDADYGSNCDRVFVAAGGPNPAAGLCGTPLTNAPDFAGVFGMTYDGPVGGSAWGLLANVNLRYETERRTRTNASTGQFDYQEATLTVNARLGFETPDERFQIELWGRNLTNEIIRTITFNTPLVGGSASAFIDEPRTYGVTVRGKF